MDGGGVSAVQPAARGYVGPGALDPAYLPRGLGGRDPADFPSRVTRLLMQKHAAAQELVQVLGAPLYMDTNFFPVVGGGQLDTCTFKGRKMMFSLWAPHRRLLLDIFPATLPESAEMEAREAFAGAQRVRYLITPPGYTLSIDDLREALTRSPEEAVHV